MNESLRARFKRLEPLLDRALELDGAERERFIATACEVHPDLAEDLRRATSIEGALPTLGELAADAVRENTTDRRNLRAGPWRLLERLGRGGMGTVYLAERADGAFDKKVAVKLLRGQDDLRFKANLERERQVLARLEHPAIARLIDGGLLDESQPFLVMELAEGRDLDVWLREERPTLARRLAVFGQVAAAVGYAHSHLIVHRDLKPSNIRVDARDRVKLLDFGIAKLLDAEGQRVETRLLALTPQYAAPEQLEGGAITTRTDIYALGALLFLLLAGRSPHPRFDGNWAAMVESVCRHDAPLASVAAAGAEDGQAALPPGLLRGDLDAIVARALSRDPQRRYASPESLLEDLARHEDGRPVHARPRSPGYALSRWFRRNWLPASLGIAAFVLLAGAAALLAWQARMVTAQRDAARQEARRSEAVRDYLLLMFRRAAEDAPEADELRARELLQRSAARIEQEFAGDPGSRQAVLATLGELFVALQDYPAAVPMLRRFVELEDGSSGPMTTARALSDLAQAEIRVGEPAAACEHTAEALALIGDDGGARPDLAADAWMTRGICLRMAGDGEASLDAYQRAVDLNLASLGESDRRTATALNNLALGYLYAGRYAESARWFERALAAFEASGYGDTEHEASALNNLAALETFRGRPAEAEAWFERALAVREGLGESPALGALLSNYGRLLMLRGRMDEAGAMIDRALALTERFTGVDSVDSAAIRLARADHALASGRLERAAADIDAAAAAMRARLGDAHPFSLRAALAQAELDAARGRHEAARAGFDRAVAGFEAGGANARRYLAAALCARAEHALSRGRHRDAATDAGRCHAIREDLAGDGSWETVWADALAAIAEGRDASAQRAKLTAVLGAGHRLLRRLDAL